MNRTRSDSFRDNDMQGSTENAEKGELAIYPVAGSGNYNNYSLSSSQRDMQYNPNTENNQNQDATVDNGLEQVYDEREDRHDDTNSGEDEEDGTGESSKGCLSRLLGALLCIFPKVEPLPWGTFAVLTVWCAIP